MALTTTTTSLSPTSDSTTYGTSSTIAAMVAGTGGTPTGTVQFKTNGVAFGSAVNLSSGIATIQSASLPVLPGAYSISATYSGDSNFAASSTTSTSTLTVFPLPVTLNKVYDGTTTASSANLVIGNIQPGDAGNVTFTGSATLFTANLGAQNFTTASSFPQIGMPQLVNIVVSNNKNLATPYTITLPAVPGGGTYTLVAAIATAATSNTKYATITDTQGNSWAQVATGIRAPSNVEMTEIQYAKAVSGATANTITITPTGGNASSVVIMEYSGLTSTPLDKTATSSGAAAASPIVMTGPTTATTTQANELWLSSFGAEVGTPGSLSSPSGFLYITKSQYGSSYGSSANSSLFVLATNALTTTPGNCGGTVTYGVNSFGYSAMTATFKAANITSTPLVLSGSVAGNYTLAGVTAATVTAKPLTVSGITAASTTYDGTTAVKLGGTASFLPSETAGSGTSSDGKPYSVDSVSPGTVTGTLTAKDAGSQTVTTSVAITGTGNGNYSVTPQAALTQMVMPKPLNYTGISAASKGFDGGVTAVLSGTAATLGAEAPGSSTTDGAPYTGDTVSFTTGTLAGTFASPNVANNLLVTLTGGVTLTAGGQASDYSVGIPSAALLANITPATTFVGASSSENPSGYKDTVSYTATLPADATGSVVFSSPNGPISTNTVSGVSTTSLAIGSLPHGTNLITVAYLGGGNYLGSTNSVEQIVTNHPPAASANTYSRGQLLSWKILVADLLTNASDTIDGDPLSLISVGDSTNHVTLDTTSLPGYVAYYNANPVADQFSYTVTDGFGGTNFAVITLNYASTNVIIGTNSIAGITGTNPKVLTAYGVPYYNYITERSTNMTDWVDIATNAAATNGVLTITDYFGDLGSNAPASAYYRLKW